MILVKKLSIKNDNSGHNELLLEILQYLHIAAKPHFFFKQKRICTLMLTPTSTMLQALFNYSLNFPATKSKDVMKANLTALFPGKACISFVVHAQHRQPLNIDSELGH